MFTPGTIHNASAFTITVQGTGDSTTDNTNLDDAVALLNVWGKGTLIIDGQVMLSTTKAFTGSINLQGLDNNAEILVSNTGDVFTSFVWNNSFDALSLTSYPMITAKPLSEYFEPSGGYSATQGEWIVVYSEDLITGMDWHSTFRPQPMELHQISHVDGTLNRAYMTDFIIDQISVSGRVAIVPMTENIHIKDLKFSHAGNQGTFQNILRLNTCTNVLVDNITNTRNGGGAIWFNMCSNVQCTNIVYEGVERYDSVYGFVVGVVNNVQISDCVISGTRHAFTTTAGVNTAGERYGTPLNVVLNNVLGHCYTKFDENDDFVTRVLFDTHAEGWGVEFNNCTAIVSGDNAITNIGFQTRSRNTKFRNCKVIGNFVRNSTNNGAIGIRIYGAENGLVEDCYFENLWKGVDWDGATDSFDANNGRVVNCTFKELRGMAIKQDQGSGLSISNCIFNACGDTTSNEVIEFNFGSGHMVYNNYFEKKTNVLAIDQTGLNVEAIGVYNNFFKGFTGNPPSTGPLGFNNANNGPAFENTYITNNFTDGPNFSRKEGRSGLGLLSGVNTVSFSDYDFDNIDFVLNGDATVTLSGTQVGDYRVLVGQGNGGGHSLDWGSNTVWETSGYQPSGTPGDVTLYRFFYDNANFHGESRPS